MRGVRRVVPLTFGFIDLPESVLVQDAPDRELRVPVPGVLLQCDGGWLLLDTGFNTALVADPALRRRFHRDPAMRPVIPGAAEPLQEALDRAGIDIAEIRAVAVSHLHWDHAGGLRHFAGRVPVHAQRAEHEYAMQPGPEPEEHGMFRIDYDDPGIDWRLATGDTELAPGVTAVLTAGHTPGHQSFVVDLAEGGGLVFAFDAACTTDGCDREVPGGLIRATREQGADQIRRLKRLAAERGYQLIPGHDPGVWPTLAASLKERLRATGTASAS
jgi:glyoxylase-like metal-dependent hydrolase (beta-lactamase superfamily II)